MQKGDTMPGTALITGGSSGIGYATAKALKDKGYSVLISGRQEKKLAEAAQQLGVDYLVADMAIGDDLKRLAAPFQQDGLDVLVNNAALARFIPLGTLSPEDYAQFFSTNIRGPMELARELLPALEEKQGAVINISSVAVTKALVNGSLYAATKGALEALTRSLAVELAPRKIRVNAVAPGAIDTPLVQHTGWSREECAARRSKLEQIIPLRRYGQPEEVAQVVLAQIQATYVTGAVWVVDGGVSIV